MNVQFSSTEIAEYAGWFSHYRALNNNLNVWESRGFITLSELRGASVLDFGGSYGQLAIIFLMHGASDATVIDINLPIELYRNKLKQFEKLKYSQSSLEAHSKQYPGRYDFVMAHTVTEHVEDIASSFAAVYKALKPGGTFLLVHDNYYHPSGAHDNIMLQCNSDGIYGYNGPKCWGSLNKCSVSSNFRSLISTNLPWAWDEQAEKMLTPDNCDDCLFYKRTHPWAHIIYQSEFNAVFPQKCFTTGQVDSILNKITPFQLRQYVIEAGFDIDMWERSMVNNLPPSNLLDEPFCLSEADLRTVNVYARCRKK